MSNKMKVILSAAIVAVVLSLIFFAVKITPVFVISYIFALIADAGVALSLCVLKKEGLPQGYAFPFRAVRYAQINVVFSVIAVLVDQLVTMFSPILYAIIHVVILAVFVIQAVSLTAGVEHIERIGKEAEERHKELNKDKEKYWD